MAKVCVFNTAVDKDSAGQNFVSAVPVSPAPPTRTKAARLLDARDCAIEFIFTGAFPGASFGLRWWLEFWGDDVSASLQSLVPSGRLIPNRTPEPTWKVDPDVPWSREVADKVEAATSITGTLLNESSPDRQVADLTLSGGGLISNEPAERKTTLVIPDATPGIGVWVPARVFAPWMRIALYAPTQVVPGPTDFSGNGPYNLLINVHVGGHTEDAFLNWFGDRPYVYNANAGGGTIL